MTEELATSLTSALAMGLFKEREPVSTDNPYIDHPMFPYSTDVACPRCLARPGRDCYDSVRQMNSSHLARRRVMWLARAVYDKGVANGRAEVQAAVTAALQSTEGSTS